MHELLTNCADRVLLAQISSQAAKAAKDVAMNKYVQWFCSHGWWQWEFATCMGVLLAYVLARASGDVASANVILLGIGISAVSASLLTIVLFAAAIRTESRCMLYLSCFAAIWSLPSTLFILGIVLLQPAWIGWML